MPCLAFKVSPIPNKFLKINIRSTRIMAFGRARASYLIGSIRLSCFVTCAAGWVCFVRWSVLNIWWIRGNCSCCLRSNLMKITVGIVIVASSEGRFLYLHLPLFPSLLHKMWWDRVKRRMHLHRQWRRCDPQILLWNCKPQPAFHLRKLNFVLIPIR